MVVNHKGGGIAATYDHYQQEVEREVALEVWARFVDSLARPGMARPSRIAYLRALEEREQADRKAEAKVVRLRRR